MPNPRIPINSSTCKFAQLPGVSGSYFSTPDSAAASITGDIDIRAFIRPDDWTPSVIGRLVVKRNTTTSYDFYLNTTGTLGFHRLVTTSTSSASVGAADGTAKWVRVTRSAATGDVTFYTSDDGIAWTQLGVTVAGASGALTDTTEPVTIGIYGDLSASPFTGRIYRAQVYNGIAGTLAVDFNPNTYSSGSTWTSATGEVWTINGTASVFRGAWDANGPLGYLAEGARTNLCLRSQEFDDGVWIKADATVTANATTAPDGTTTADKLTEAATTAFHYTWQTPAVSAGVVTISFYSKAAERSKTWAYLNNGATATAYFDLSAGTVGTVSGSGSPSATITACANGWYRCTLTATVPMNAPFGVGVTTTDNVGSYLGTLGSGIYLWGAQLEAASFASSYIPTTTAAVTRNADVLTYPSSGNIDGTRGSVFYEYTPINPVVGVNAVPVGSNGVNRLLIYSDGSKLNHFDGTNNPNFQLSVTFTASVINKAAQSWEMSAARGYLNGAALTSNPAAFDGDYNFTDISIGIANNNTANSINGTVRNVKLYPRALTAAQLQAMTA